MVANESVEKHGLHTSGGGIHCRIKESTVACFRRVATRGKLFGVTNLQLSNGRLVAGFGGWDILDRVQSGAR